jgi:hypothetical protein
MEKRCNGFPDCREGEDEDNCELDQVDEEIQTAIAGEQGGEEEISPEILQFTKGKCSQSNEMCLFLLLSSPPPLLHAAPPPSCDSLDEFPCKDDGSCRPIDVRCDGMVDCNDESDEFDCPTPQEEGDRAADKEAVGDTYQGKVAVTSSRNKLLPSAACPPGKLSIRKTWKTFVHLFYCE